MFRLVSWPYPEIVGYELLSGPIAVSSGSTSSMAGREQTFDGVGETIVMRFDLSDKWGVVARRERGAFLALQGGVNAFRVPLPDFDRMSFAEAGGTGAFAGVPWGNGETWSNGEAWQPAYPRVDVGEAAAYDSGIVALADQFWGHQLGVGDRIGFTPLHFGVYWITEVLAAGRYRIWPRLRRAIDTGTIATLDCHVLAMRPLGREALAGGRDLDTTKGTSITLHEVIDPYVRQYFTG